NNSVGGDDARAFYVQAEDGIRDRTVTGVQTCALPISMGGGGLEPCITVLGNTSKTGYRSHDVHGTNGISPTIQARDYKGPKQIAIREATKKGYTVAEPGDRVNISFPDSETSSGRVGKQTANTLLTGEEQEDVLAGRS